MQKDIVCIDFLLVFLKSIYDQTFSSELLDYRMTLGEVNCLLPLLKLYTNTSYLMQYDSLSKKVDNQQNVRGGGGDNLPQGKVSPGTRQTRGGHFTSG